MKKEVVIIIPGAIPLKKYPSTLKNLGIKMGRMFNIRTYFEDHPHVWKKSKVLRKKNFIWMHWTRGIGLISKFLAKRKLKRLLTHYKNENVKLVGVSLGGEIILETLKNQNYKNIKKVILVCSINEMKQIEFKHPPIVNIFSEEDKFAQLAIKLYSPIHGGERLYGKAIENIEIPQMQHADFCSDVKIKEGKFKGKRVTELIALFLR